MADGKDGKDGKAAENVQASTAASNLPDLPVFPDLPAIINQGHRRTLDLALELPGSPLEAVMSGEVWGEVYDRLAELIKAHKTTLVFVNTRRLAERVSRHLAERHRRGCGHSPPWQPLEGNSTRCRGAAQEW